jgi:hypothetical protein
MATGCLYLAIGWLRLAIAEGRLSQSSFGGKTPRLRVVSIHAQILNHCLTVVIMFEG